ncbi:MAG: 30S ribosomal protein S1, partial [Gammaproteobacteria bacterium]|nr:30S ribosomal protein S1 [Gammaproteobacteria bacterium]
MMENFEALLNESMDAVEMKPGELIMGDVMEANDDYVIISVGLKSDAEVPANEFKNASGDLTVTIGDRVEVALEAVEDGNGSTRVSREKAMRVRAWAEVAEAYENDKIVSGMIAGKVKGGFTVDLYGLRAFLPGSLVDIRPIKDSAYIEGRDLEFKVIKLDQNKNNIVVSRRAIVENELVEEREKLLETLQEGQIVNGIVKNLTDYGAFVNLGGLDGLLHITDIAWKRIRHPSEVLSVGDEVEVRVLKFDRNEGRVSLGLKQLGQDPWLDLAECHPIGSKLFGRVTNITDYGAFVELQEGVEGLVHLSEMDWTKKNIHPGRVCHIGDEVEVMVLDIDSERRRISLGMKQCIPNPWAEFAAIHKKGDRITGQIRSITDFG